MRWVLLTICFHLSAAGPFFHLYLADQWCDEFSVDNRAEFCVGTLFPDIRYVADIPRSNTHDVDVSVVDIAMAKTPFIAGVKLHCLVDEVRERLVVASGAYRLVEGYADEHLSTLLKLVEDEILFNEMNTAVYPPYFRKIPFEELEQGVAQEDVEKWHHFVYMSLVVKPSDLARLGSQGKGPMFSVSSETLSLWAELVPQLAKTPEMQAHVQNLRAHFKLLFSTAATSAI